jgi:hypothetical protein
MYNVFCIIVVMVLIMGCLSDEVRATTVFNDSTLSAAVKRRLDNRPFPNSFCYLKHRISQGCFHISGRCTPDNRSITYL